MVYRDTMEFRGIPWLLLIYRKTVRFYTEERMFTSILADKIKFKHILSNNIGGIEDFYLSDYYTY